MLAPWRWRRWVAYGAAGISILVVWVARWSIDPVLEGNASFSFFFLAVSVAAWLGGFWPALFTIIVSCLVGNYNFEHPNGGFPISGLDELIGLGIFIVVSLIIAVLAETSLRALERAEKRNVLRTISWQPWPTNYAARCR